MKKILLSLLVFTSILLNSQTLIKLKQLEKSSGASSIIVTDAMGTPGYSTTSASPLWSINGNAISTNTNFVGSTTNRPLNFRINNAASGLIDTTGDAYFGYKCGKLDVTKTNSNTAFGCYALASITGAEFVNCAFGSGALQLNNGGSSNCAFGYNTLSANTTGGNNVALGESALFGNTTGVGNIGIGKNAGGPNQTGIENTIIGYRAMQNGTLSSNWNTAVGSNAMFLQNGGDRNSTFGAYSLYTNTTGFENTGIGYDALARNTTGNNNIAIGYYAGEYNTTQSGRFYLNNIDRGSIAGDSTGSILYGYQNVTPTQQRLYCNAQLSVTATSSLNGLQLVAGSVSVTAKVINTTAGDVATINSPVGRFRKDNTGSSFVLTNSLVTANSIIILTLGTTGITTGYQISVQPSAGSATITFETAGIAAAPSANCDVNFQVVN